MKVLIKKDWNYSLIEDEGKYFLMVLCGTVALYELKIELNTDEIMQFTLHGSVYIEKLVNKIRNNPDLYNNRSN